MLRVMIAFVRAGVAIKSSRLLALEAVVACVFILTCLCALTISYMLRNALFCRVLTSEFTLRRLGNAS